MSSIFFYCPTHAREIDSGMDLDEDTYRRLMHLYAVSGDRAAALRTYHTCVTVLERELATEPDRATREIYERLLHTEVPPTEQKVSSPALAAVAPFVGRQPEWEQLQTAWRSASAARSWLTRPRDDARLRADREIGTSRRCQAGTGSARCVERRRVCRSPGSKAFDR